MAEEILPVEKSYFIHDTVGEKGFKLAQGVMIQWRLKASSLKKSLLIKMINDEVVYIAFRCIYINKMVS